MSYNGSGTFQINTSGQPVVTGTSISSTVFNALTADLATGLSTAITKDGQTTTTARIPFALGINSTLVTDATNTTSGSIITAGGVGIAKALFVGTTANVAGAVTLGGVATFSAQPIFSSLTASSAVATDASKGLVSVTNTGTGNNVLATGPTISGPTISDGTANGVAYLNGSKVLTTGSALVFDGSNLGVGVTPSAWASGTYKVVQLSGGGAFSGSSGQVNISQNFVGESGGEKYIATAAATSYAQTAGQHRWYNAPSGTAGNIITFTQAMTLDASGQLGIGTSSPDAKVHSAISSTTLSSIIASNANDYDQFQIRQPTRGGNFGWSCSGAGSENYVVIDRQRSNQVLEIHGTTNHIWNISNAEVVRINDSGSLLVGVTSYADGNMFYKSSLTALNCWRGSTTANEGAFGVYSNVGGTQTIRAYIRNDGGLANYSANNVNLSDERLKKDIALAGNYLDKICAIPVKNFRYKDQSESEDITLGVIAQDVLAIAPELVSQDGFGVNDENQQDYLSIYQTDMQYALMKCIQEQQALITQLQADVAALKGA